MSTMVPELGELEVTADQVQERYKLATPEEAQRVLDLALTELGRALETVWRPVPAPTYQDWIIRTCGSIVAAKKRPTAGSSQETRADQGAPRPGGPREYLAPLRGELAHYTAWGIG